MISVSMARILSAISVSITAHIKSMPPILVAAELILAVVLVRYILNFTHLISPMPVSFWSAAANIFSILLSMTMCILSVNSIMGLSSSKLRSWRTVVRSSISLFITNQIFFFLNQAGVVSSGIFMDNGIIGMMVLLSIVIMFLPSVRRFYVPPVYESPPLRTWIRFLIFAPSTRGLRYSASYSDQETPADMIDATDSILNSVSEMEAVGRR